MKKEVLELSIQEYFEVITPQYLFQEQLLIMDLNGSAARKDGVPSSNPMRIKASSLILVLAGEISIEVDYLPHRLKPQTVMQLTADNIIENIACSNDLQGYLIFFSSELKQEIISLTSGIRISNAHQLKRMHPKQELTENEYKTVVDRIERMKEYITDVTHLYRSAIIKNEVISLLLDLDNSRWQRHGEGRILSIYNETICQRFHQLILENCKNHRDVSFYAEKLCITPDYLSKAVKEYDKQSALKWISNAVVTEAKMLLRQPDFSIYQIAFELNFTDQSTFGKFFKRNAGITPVQYRKEYNRSK